MTQDQVIWFRIDGPGIKDHAIDVNVLARNLLNINKLTVIIARSQRFPSNLKMASFNLYLSKFLEGSIVAGLEMKPDTHDQIFHRGQNRDPYVAVTDELIETIQHTRTPQDLAYFRQKYVKPEERIDVLSCIESLCPTDDEQQVKIALKAVIPTDRDYTISLTDATRSMVSKWIVEEAIPPPNYLIGLYYGMKFGHPNSTLWLKEENADVINCSIRYETFQEKLDEIHLLDRVKIWGTLKLGKKNKTRMVNVQRIQTTNLPILTIDQVRPELVKANVSEEFLADLPMIIRKVQRFHTVLQRLGEYDDLVS